MSDTEMSRRAFLTAATGTATVAATGAAGSAAAQEGNGTATPGGESTASGGSTPSGESTASGGSTPSGSSESGGGGGGGGSASGKPDFGGYLDGIDGGYQDMRGSSEVTVSVGAEGNGGALAFAPAGIWVDSGTTVKFEWTGEGGGHNVIAEEGPASLDSGAPVSESGVQYEYTFESGGITTYFCDPHKSLGMKGAVAVGGEVPTVETGGGGGGGGGNVPEVPESAKTLGVATTFAMVATMGLAFFFLKYGGDYETPDE